MTHLRSKAVLLCAVCLLSVAGGVQAQQSGRGQPVSITGSAAVTSRIGSASATVGQPSTRPTTPRQQEQDARNRAVRARNARFLRSRVPALHKLHSLRQWQAANAREREQQQGNRRRSR